MLQTLCATPRSRYRRAAKRQLDLANPCARLIQVLKPGCTPPDKLLAVALDVAHDMSTEPCGSITCEVTCEEESEVFTLCSMEFLSVSFMPCNALHGTAGS